MIADAPTPPEQLKEAEKFLREWKLEIHKRLGPNGEHLYGVSGNTYTLRRHLKVLGQWNPKTKEWLLTSKDVKNIHKLYAEIESAWQKRAMGGLTDDQQWRRIEHNWDVWSSQGDESWGTTARRNKPPLTAQRDDPLASPIAVENKLESALHNVATNASKIVDNHAVISRGTDDARALIHIARDPLMAAADRYASTLSAWAKPLINSLLSEVDTHARAAITGAIGEQIGINFRLRNYSGDAAVIKAKEEASERIHNLITSIPTAAALRALKLAEDANLHGRRAAEVADEIERTNQVTHSRATLIARTEIARANHELSRARAIDTGAKRWAWRTMEDGDVRESHAEMDGQEFDYGDVPTLSDGTEGEPGTFPNCRCYAEPLFTSLVS